MNGKITKSEFLYDLTQPASDDDVEKAVPQITPDRISHSDASSQTSDADSSVNRILIPVPELARPPTEDDFQGWPDSPLILRPSNLMAGKLFTEDVTKLALNSKVGLKFENEYFKGRAWFFVRGVETMAEDMFEGKKRKSHLVVRGQFKKSIGSHDLVTGQDFQRAAKNLPAPWLVDRIFALIGKILGSRLLIGKSTERPFLMGSILTLAQAIRVTPEGQEVPPIFPIVEDMKALGIQELCNRRGHPVSSSVRKWVFQSHQIQKKVKFQLGPTWTFHIWQHLVDLSTYELHLIKNWDLCRYLDGQPIQFMAKDLKSGNYLWNFEVWHKQLLKAAWEQYKQQHQQSDVEVNIQTE